MSALDVRIDAGIATVTIDNPTRRNSLTLEMWQRFPQVMGELARDPAVTVVVIRGAGADFSSGADIRDLPAIFAGDEDGGYVTAAENAIAAFPGPTIAAIDGFCVGGGWEIAGACDFRVASSRAVFGVTPARIGILYPLSGIRRLVSIAGPAVAKALLLSGELVDADRALGWGLVTRVYDADGFWERVAASVADLSARSQLSMSAMKDLVNAIDEGADVEARLADWKRELVSSDDPDIGAAAFLARIEPRFSWRRA